MKIGVYISPRHKVPPDEQKILAPWYLMRDFVNGLVQKGHEVYLFAAVSSKTKAILYDCGIKPYPHNKQLTMPDWEAIKKNDQLLFSKMLEIGRSLSLDIYHLNQLEYVDDIILNSTEHNNYVFTLHDPINTDRRRMLKTLSRLPNCFFVSISNSQRGDLPFGFLDTVYNGTNLADYPFQDTSSDYILFMGRIRREKGLHTAISVALKLNIPLEIGASISLVANNDEYFQKEIKPFLDNPLIGEPGFLKGKNKRILYAQAKLLLFPIEWEEPFGLVMTEAMSCGTPVVAYARGSVPEIIVDGETGFIVNSSADDIRGNWIIKKTGLEGLIEGVNKIYSMEDSLYKKMRFACRRHVEDNFSIEKMVEGYEGVYRKILGVT